MGGDVTGGEGVNRVRRLPGYAGKWREETIQEKRDIATKERDKEM